MVVMMKPEPLRDINRKHRCWPGTHPTPRTNQASKYKAKLNLLSYLQMTDLKNKATSKAEYANTQEGLPDLWVYIAHLSIHARLFGWEGLFY
jgi:hypothetical protein